MELEQLEYQTIDTTVVDAEQRMDFGTFCSSDLDNPSMDITSAFAVDFAEGERDFLYRLNPDGGNNNTYAQFKCQMYTLTVQYLIP